MIFTNVMKIEYLKQVPKIQNQNPISNECSGGIYRGELKVLDFTLVVAQISAVG